VVITESSRDQGFLEGYRPETLLNQRYSPRQRGGKGKYPLTIYGIGVKNHRYSLK
jgi:hypothetical protein